MEKRILLKGWLAVLLVALLGPGCNKEDDVGNQSPDPVEFAFNDQEVVEMLPDGLLASTDPKAQECIDLILQALDMSAFQSNLVVPDNAQPSSKKASGDTWTWTFSYMGGTWTFYWTWNEDATRYYWNMEIQFEDGELYDYITAWQMKDGSAGEVIYSFNWVLLYDQDHTDYVDLHWTYSWDLDGSGTYHFSWSYDSENTEFNYYMNYVIVIDPDGSGQLDYYYLDQLYYHMEWDADGNGSWHYYFGGVEESGSWMAG